MTRHLQAQLARRIHARTPTEAAAVEALVADLEAPTLADVLRRYIRDAQAVGTDDEIRALRGVLVRIQRWETGQ